MTAQARPATFKITYATLGADMEQFHQDFQAALDRLPDRLGTTWGCRIGGQEVRLDRTFDDISPIDGRRLMGRFALADAETVQRAFQVARAAWPGWRDTPWPERVATLRRAAEIISRDKFDLAAAMATEVGKNRLEAMGDVEEAADLLRYYAQQMESANGFEQPLGSLTPNEHTRDVLRPHGVFAVIAPFNFPLALAAGMSAGALVAGNTVVLKPASDAPMMSCLFERVLHEAGLPSGVLNVVTGSGSVFGEVLLSTPDVHGIAFTGSKEIGMQLYHEFSRSHARPCLLELGGKNPALVMETADVDQAAEGVMRSAFGYGGQKCSACSRVYVHQAVYDRFVALLVEKTGQLVMGDPTRRDVYLGPVINAGVVKRHQEWVKRVRQDGGSVLAGGRVHHGGELGTGYYVEPTIVADLPHDHPVFGTELFLPLLAVARVESLAQAIELSNRAEYGLTAGIFTGIPAEIETFFNEIEAGICYANRRTGATTGAWPGVQSFCGWKGSGSTGKGGCGPYYVSQFMREQSRTVMG